MANLLRAECLKIRKSMGFWAPAIISVAATALLFAFNAKFADAFTAQGMFLNGTSAFYQALGQAQMNLFLVGVFVPTLVCAEFSTRTQGVSLFSGFSRLKLLAAKIGAVLIGAAALAAIMPLLMLASFTVARGLGGSLGELAAPMLRDFGLYLLGNMAMAAFCALLAYIIRDVGGVVGACVGINIVLYFAALVRLDSVQRVLKFSFMTHLMKIGQTGQDIPLCIGVMAVTLAVSVAGAAALFEKSELK
jgi:ABC-type transport system involved in multi-copper enzyme maturation permease subunit